MSNFDDTLARMKSLCTYGMVNENEKKEPTCTLEYTKKAADGKYYGIVKEFNSYYIKQSTEGKQSIAESYNYIGGFMNKKDYQYDSYNNALKHLELKLSSINEAQEGKVNIETLDPFKKGEIVIEGTDKMKNEIARQRQIMYNASMLMNESIGFSNTGVPEANHTSKGSSTVDKNAPFTETAKYEEEHKGSAENPEKQGKPFGNGEATENGKDVKDANVPSNGTAVAAQHPSGGKVSKVNEGTISPDKLWGNSCTDNNGNEQYSQSRLDRNGNPIQEEASATDTDFDEGCDKGQDPASIGWDMDNQTKVNEGEDETCPHCGCKKGTCTCCKQMNEEENDWASEGLPADSQAGVGSPDGHLMEDSEEDDVYIDDDEGDEDEELFSDTDIEDVDEPEEDDDTFGEEEPEDLEGEDLEGDEEPEDLEGDEEIEDFDENDPEALRAKIEELQAKLAELEGDEEPVEDFEGEEEIEDFEDEEPEDFEGEELEEGIGRDALRGAYKYGKESAINGPDNDSVMATRQTRRNYLKNGGGQANYEKYMQAKNKYDENPWNDDTENLASDVPAYQPGLGGKLNRAAQMAAYRVGNLAGKAKNFVNNGLGVATESKKAELDRIVESVAKSFLKEDELHVFGDHPGYRKKPMNLPPTGSDKNEHGEDINDDSVHNEEPFGKQIGDSSPFNQLVNAVMNDVKYQLKHGVPLDNKKKVN